MSLQTKLSNVYSTLAAVEGLKCYHYFAPSETVIPYAVWYEDGEEGGFQADSHKAEQAFGGYLDYYTKTEFDSMCDTIQTTLNSIEGLSFVYESVIYGDPTHDNNNTIHHVWRWWVYG